MKTAEEVADQIIASMGMAISRSNGDRDWLIKKLTAFAAEAAIQARSEELGKAIGDAVVAFNEGYTQGKQENHKHIYLRATNDAYRKARAEALEEAATIADERRGTKLFGDMTMWEDGAASASEAIAERIRALINQKNGKL